MAILKFLTFCLAIEMHKSLRRLGDSMLSAFALWVGQPVILQVAADGLCVPLRGMIVGESKSTVLFRVEEALEDIDIYKCMILAVEEDSSASILVN
jgi:hypothetical protein